MTDRTVLADALQGATVEMLREDAEAMMLAVRYERPDSPAQPRIRRLAALALAVAEMQEHGAFVDGGALPWTLDLGGCDDQTDVTHPTLPAALAKLLRGAP